MIDTTKIVAAIAAAFSPESCTAITEAQASRRAIAAVRSLAAPEAPTLPTNDEVFAEVNRLRDAVSNNRYVSTNAVNDTMQAVRSLLASTGAAPAAPAKPLAHGHRDDYYLMANARRLLGPSRMPNWGLAQELFATGSNSAHQICRDAGIDPDATTITRKAQKGSTE